MGPWGIRDIAQVSQLLLAGIVAIVADCRQLSGCFPFPFVLFADVAIIYRT